MAPVAAPSRAPTIPPQKRSGRNTVKCQRATPIVNQTTAAIRYPSRSSAWPPVLSLALLAARLLFAHSLHRRRARVAQLGALALGGAIFSVIAVRGRGAVPGRRD